MTYIMLTLAKTDQKWLVSPVLFVVKHGKNGLITKIWRVIEKHLVEVKMQAGHPRLIHL